MGKPSIRLDQPSSPEAVQRVWEAYGKIPEKDKKRLLKVLHQKVPEVFQYLLKRGGFPAGLLPAKVENRELSYGRTVDTFLRNHKDGSFGEDALGLYLEHWDSGPAWTVRKVLLGSHSKDEAERRLENMLVENPDDPMTILGVRYFQAYINLEGTWIRTSKIDNEPEGEESKVEPVDTHEAVEGDLEAETKSAESESESPGDSGESSVTAVLDQALDDVAKLAGQAKLAKPWSEGDWREVINGAQAAVTQVRAEVERLATAAGRDFPEWETRPQLDRLLEELKDAGDGKHRREKLIKFLKSLEAEVRALNPVHKLSAKREKLAQVRDAAADEISEAQKHECVQWIDDGPGDAREWLDKVMQLDESGLEQLIASLTSTAYPKTARLVEDLEQGYELGVNRGVGTESIGTSEPKGENQPSDEPTMIASKTPDGFTPPGTSSKPKKHARREKPSPTPSKKDTPKASTSSEQEDSQGPQLAKDTVESGGAKDDSPVTSKTSESPAPPAKVTVESVREKEASPPADPNSTNVKPWQEQDGSDVEEEVFEPLGDLAASATAAMVGSEAEVEATIEKIVWNLLGQGERGLAFEVLKNANETGLTNAFPVHSSALEILALLPAYSSNSSEVPHRIRTILQSEDFSDVFKSGEPKANHLRRLLLAAALLRSSLFDPSSNAGAVLDGLRLGKFPSLHRIANALAEFGRKGVDLNATILLATRNTKGWKKAENEIIEAVQRFLDGALARNMHYAPATRIWRHWFQDRGGWMRGLFGLAVNQDRKSMEKLASDLQSVDVEEEIRKGWEESKGRGQLVGIALESLRRLSSEAIDLLVRRLDHWKSGPDNDSDYRQKVVEEHADTVVSNLAFAKIELGQMADAGQPFDERNRISTALMLEELDRLGEALDGTNLQVQCPSLKEWLHADLMRLDYVEMDNTMDVSLTPLEDIQDFSGFWNENDPARIRLASELLAMRNPIQNCRQAFDGALTRSDHRKARWILDQMARNDALGLSELEARKTSQLEETRNRLRGELQAVEGELGSAFSKGWITPDSHVGLLELIHRRLQNLSERNDEKDFPYYLWRDDVTKVKQVIRSAHAEQVLAAERSLRTLDQASSDDIERVRDVLSKGNVHLANEYIQRLIAGESIKHSEDISPNRFFAELYGDSETPGHFIAIQELLLSSTFNPVQAISEIQNNETWCGIDLQGLDSTSRSASASALHRWFSAQKSKKIDDKGVEAILRVLDFPIANISHTKDAFVTHFAGVIPCPIPDYGSEIRSKKIVVIVELQRTSADDVAQYLDRLRLGTNPVILLWMRPIELRLRRKFARTCRQKSLKVLMVDSILAAYLFTVAGQRIRALFECGLPFTNVSPYLGSGPALFLGRPSYGLYCR